MDYRFIVIRLALMLLPPIIARLKEEAKKTPSPLDDSIIEIGEVILKFASTGQLADILKKPQ